MLIFDPVERISAEQALNHKYFQDLHEQEDEPKGNPINVLEFQFENHELSIEKLKDVIYEEILLYHFEDFRTQYKNRLNSNLSVQNHIINSNDDFTHSDEGQLEELEF